MNQVILLFNFQGQHFKLRYSLQDLRELPVKPLNPAWSVQHNNLSKRAYHISCDTQHVTLVNKGTIESMATQYFGK